MRTSFIRAACTAFLLSWATASAATAGTVEDGDKAYMAGDYAKAMDIWRPLAEAGDPYLQFLVGSMYVSGQGVAQDFVAAAEWYRRAAEQGLAEAQSSLAYMYVKGHGVLQDFVQAHKWYNLAGAHGEETGRKDRDIVAKKMSPGQIAEAQQLAREWLAKARKN